MFWGSFLEETKYTIIFFYGIASNLPQLGASHEHTAEVELFLGWSCEGEESINHEEGDKWSKETDGTARSEWGRAWMLNWREEPLVMSLAPSEEGL